MRGPQNFTKSRSNLKITVVRRVILETFHNQGPKMLATSI